MEVVLSTTPSDCNFNHLKRQKIQDDPSFEGPQMANWVGKSTEELIDSIYKKINELINLYPHNKEVVFLTKIPF